MRIVETFAGEPFPSLFLVGGRSFAVLAGGALRLVDLDGSTAPRHVIEDVVAAAATDASLVTLQAGGRLSRWEPAATAGRYRVARCCNVTPRARAMLAVSPSGRFVVVDGAEAEVVDLEHGSVVATLSARLGTARPSFDRLPDGREVLFVAAPGYMSVAVYAPGRSEPIAGYTEQQGWDFCHVGFRLAGKGDLLVTFGCVWAAPYETRIYDARAWTRAAPCGLGDTMLPLVRTIRPLASNTLIETDVGPDGALTSACIEIRADLAPDEDGDLAWDPGELARKEGPIAEKLDALPDGPEAALIVRVLDPMTAETVRAGVWGVPGFREVDLHHVDGHRVIAVGPEILVADPVEDRLTRHGGVHVASGDRTAVTRDGEVVVIARA